jgi:hypothetical protein
MVAAHGVRNPTFPGFHADYGVAEFLLAWLRRTVCALPPTLSFVGRITCAETQQDDAPLSGATKIGNWHKVDYCLCAGSPT